MLCRKRKSLTKKELIGNLAVFFHLTTEHDHRSFSSRKNANFNDLPLEDLLEVADFTIKKNEAQGLETLKKILPLKTNLAKGEVKIMRRKKDLILTPSLGLKMTKLSDDDASSKAMYEEAIANNKLTVDQVFC